jgi:hypothetical protein
MSINIEAQIKMPAASPSAVVKQDVGLSNITIEYSRPSLKGRKMMGTDVIPYGKIWRTGANGIPKITITEEVAFEGNKVAPGTYGIMTIPNENEWTIIISKNAKQWGTYSYKQEEDLVRFNVKAEKLKDIAEHFTIGFTDFSENSAKIYIKWENHIAKFTVTNSPDAAILQEINLKTAAADATSDTYFDAADYYYNKGLDLNKALDWANKVVEKDKQYWTYYLRGKIAAKAGKCNIALSDAKEGIVLAKKENDMSYVKNLESLVTTCTKK